VTEGTRLDPATLRSLDGVLGAQASDGRFPDLAPHPLQADMPSGTPGWADAGTICPWTIYQAYGHRRVLEQHYPAMVQWVEWCRQHSTGLIRDKDRGHDYGDRPKGLLIIDRQGHYSLQIYDSLRPHYASGDRARGTPTEYQTNALGISTHFGTVQVDAAAGVLILNVESASFPNQDGQQQKRLYKLDGDELSYRVQARPNGDVPVSVWRRLE